MEETTQGPTAEEKAQQVEIITQMVEGIFDKLKGGVEDLKAIALNDCMVKPEKIRAIFAALPINNNNPHIKEAIDTLAKFVGTSNNAMREKINAFQITPEEIEQFKNLTISKITSMKIDPEEMKFYTKIQEAVVTFGTSYIQAVQTGNEITQAMIDLIEASKTE